MSILRDLHPLMHTGLALALLGACGSVTANPPDAGAEADATVASDAAPDAEPATYTVSGTVTGFAGKDLVLQLNGANDLAILADGTFSFTTTLLDAAQYAVTTLSEPTCPQRYCTLANESGTISGADITNVTLSCAEPKYRLISNNWGDSSIRITDDIAALADASTADPRVISGDATGLGNSNLDSVGADPDRDLIYASNGTAILVWENASTVDGNIAPTRTIIIQNGAALNGIEIDSANNRLYATGGANLMVFESASTLTGEVTPDAVVALTSPRAVALDSVNNILYVGGYFSEELFVFDNASAITSATTPSRTALWVDGQTGFNGPSTIAPVDSI